MRAVEIRVHLKHYYLRWYLLNNNIQIAIISIVVIVIMYKMG